MNYLISDLKNGFHSIEAAIWYRFDSTWESYWGDQREFWHEINFGWELMYRDQNDS